MWKTPKAVFKIRICRLADFSRPAGTVNLSEQPVRSVRRDLICQETY